MTLFDFAASSLPSFATRSAAPGISRSITYFGMADPPRLDGADSMSASPALSGALGRKSRRRPYGRLASPMAAPRPVSAAEIESLAIGAWILGTGGGGSPYLALLNMRKLYREGAVVWLLDPRNLADDDPVAVVSNMGAPLVGQERLTDPRTIARAVTMMEEYIGRRFAAIMSLEIGGGNALQPFMAAALLDRPVVDADCMGRAFPEAQMTSFAIHDLPMYPLTLVDVRDNAVIVARARRWKGMEGFLRGGAALEGVDEDRGHAFALAFQNEFAVGWLDGVPRVMTPDLICMLDTVSGEAIGTETLRYGHRATVIALPAPPILATPKGIQHVGPRAFGYDLEFRSVFAS